MCVFDQLVEKRSIQVNKHMEYNSFLSNAACTVLVIIKLTKFAVALRLRCGSCKLIFDIISSFFAKFKNVVHSLEPGETPSNSASRQAPNYVQCRKIL